MLAQLGTLGPLGVLAWVIGLLVAIGVHEYAHARAAYALGDATAADAGRMTMNPFRHLSPIGTLLLVLVGFGWSQPVPIDGRNFRFPRRDTLLTAFAGPVMNILVAAIVGLLTRFAPDGTRLPELAATVMYVNFLLAFFNIIPIPPLDGAAILPYLFERRPEILQAIHQQGFFLLIAILLADSLFGHRILGTLVQAPATALAQLFLGRVGF